MKISSSMAPGPQRSRRGISSNLILALVLIAISSFVYWYEFKKKGEREHAADSKTKLLALDQNREIEDLKIVDQEKALNVEMKCKEHCKLSDPGAQWEITSPIQFKADEGNVGTFITSLTSAMVGEVLPLEGDLEGRLKAFGLGKEKRDANKTTFKLKADTELYVVYFGDNSAVGENLYVYVTGPNQKLDVVRLIPSYIKNNLQRGLSYWRAKRLIEASANDVQGFTLTNASGTSELVRDAGNWYLPQKRLADTEAVDTFITGLIFTNVQDYVSDDKIKDRAKLGLSATPKATLNLKISKRPDLKIEIYDVLSKEKQPKLYAIMSDKSFIAELERTSSERFTKKPEAFRFRNLLTPVENYGVMNVKLKVLGKEEYEFKKEGTTWKVLSGQLSAFDPGLVDQALTRIGAARIAEFLGNKPIPKGALELSAWNLFDNNGKLLRAFTVYTNGDKSEYYAKLSNGEVAKLERGSGSAIPHEASQFQKAPVPAPSSTPGKK